MHLRLAGTARIDEGEAVDLALAPAEIVILSAADSELTAFAQAVARASAAAAPTAAIAFLSAANRIGAAAPSETAGLRSSEPPSRTGAGLRTQAAPEVRLVSLSALSHPMSVDLLAERTLAAARVIAVRLLGGEGYFGYGMEVLRRTVARTGAALIVVPGEAEFDTSLAARGTVSAHVSRAFHAYCREGGPANRDRAIEFLRALLTDTALPPGAAAMPAAGLYHRGRMLAGLSELTGAGPAVGLVFYRAHLMDGQVDGIDALAEALAVAGLRPVPIYASSLKDRVADQVVRALLDEAAATLVLTTMAFSAAAGPGTFAELSQIRAQLDAGSVQARSVDQAADASPALVRPAQGTALDGNRRVVLTAVQASLPSAAWEESTAGLPIRDLAMSVVTPEFDGRVLTRAFAFKTVAERDVATGAYPATFVPLADRTRFVARLAAAHVRLAATPFARKRIALVLANYPGKDGRIANGVGLDTPASTIAILAALEAAGMQVSNAPQSSAALMAGLIAGRTNPPERLSLATYREWVSTLPQKAASALIAQWGAPENDPTLRENAFAIPAYRFGNVVVAVQPTRGYERDPKATYHDPALVPTHGYLAFYLWLREAFGADAVLHVGKHGNLEWLPGKATALSESCWPEIAFGPTPHVYPFIVNDPGEGAQAKRRAQAVIVDHLTPPMTRAGSHGAGATLEALIDEYALARTIDPRRAARVAADLLDLAGRHGFVTDLGIGAATTTAIASRDETIAALDAHICDLKELQIRDGLHVLGASPTGGQRRDTLVAIARATRGPGEDGTSILRAIAADFGLGFDPLTADMAAPWDGPRPAELAALAPFPGPVDAPELADAAAAQLADAAIGPWRTAGDTIERLEAFAAALFDDLATPGPCAKTVLAAMSPVAAALDASGKLEIAAVLCALNGRFVPPGPSGAPTRGRPDVLPTGRNFYAVDIRAVPTRVAWEIGRAAAERVVERYVMEEGDWPRSIVLTCWGTANMRTGGEDIAQGLALIGAEPNWEDGRLTGFSVIPLGRLMRPRVDVTLRVSGFFRDAFPEQIILFDAAARAVAALDEPAEQNPLRARFRTSDISVFGSMPGAYGAGLQTLIDTSAWESRADLAEAFVAWGHFAYGRGRAGEAEEGALRARLAGIDAVVQAQDNREHDILDSDDYYQFEGGLAAAVELARGRAPTSLHVDTSRAERPIARTLAEEIARTVRGRAANPKWIAGVMRHGYKGAFEIAATVDYLFAFAATTDAVRHHQFDQLYDAYIADETVAAFIAEANAPALGEIAARFAEAIDRGLWRPAKNSVRERLDALRGS